MKIHTYILKGKNNGEISTEIKFHLASARFDGAELIRFVYDNGESEKEASRLYNVIIKILRSLKLKSSFQFFVTPLNFEEGRTECEFLLNKYPEHFSDAVNSENEGYFYVKM